MVRPVGTTPISDNRRARYEYELLDRLEAGLVLTGTEVKSLREGGVDLARAYVDLREGEAWLIGASIAEWAQSGASGHRPGRDRKLLLHRHELDRLARQVHEKGLTVVPTRMYFKNGRVKVEIAVARGKSQVDRRRDIAARDARREMERALKRRR